MESSKLLEILLALNNYSHDFAAALLLASVVPLFCLRKIFGGEDYSIELQARVFGILSKLAMISLFWIVAAGSVRTVFYVRFEWNGAVGNAQVPMLVLKHAIFFVLTAAGIYYWLKMRKRIYEAS